MDKVKLSVISRKINRQPKTIEKLKENDAAFSYFIGKQYIDLTLDELSFLQYRMQDNCLMLKSLDGVIYVMSDLGTPSVTMTGSKGENIN